MPQREYPTAPLVGIGAVLVDSQGRVLLIKRAHEPRKGHWSIPGGLLELGESLMEGVRREVAEETGLLVEPIALVEVVDRIYRDAAVEPEQQSALESPSNFSSDTSRVRYHYVIVDFWCRVAGGHLLAASDAEDARWVNRSELTHHTNVYSLESLTIDVIEKGWQMARAAGVCA